MRTFIIAEVGVNHNGSITLARELVEAAAAAGADATKFQSFLTDELVTRNAPKALYQRDTAHVDDSQHAMLQGLELSEADHILLAEHCDRCGVQFLSTPFDVRSLELLVDRLDMPRIKISSGDITNGPLLLAAAQTDRPVILSTGMSTLSEVEQALGVLAFGYTHPAGTPPGAEAFAAAYASEDGQAMLRGRVTLLHCTSQYPAPAEDAHLRVLETLRSAFGLPVGYSDHTMGIAVPTAAVALGAVLVEKHLTSDRTLPGPDHKASLEPHELSEMVRAIRQVEVAMGRPVKAPTPGERETRMVARRSLRAARRILEGEPFTEENIVALRPGNGISPMNLWNYLGTQAPRSYDADEPLS